MNLFGLHSKLLVHLSMFSPTQGRAGIPMGIWHFHFFFVSIAPTVGHNFVVKSPHPWVCAVVNVFEQTKTLLLNAHFIAVISPVQTWTWNIMLWFGFNRNYEMLTLEIHVQVNFDLCVINTLTKLAFWIFELSRRENNKVLHFISCTNMNLKDQ